VYRTKGGPTISSTQATETTTISGHGSHGAPGILLGFLSETIAFRPDSEGEVVAILVTRRAAVRTPLDGAARHLEEGSGAEADDRARARRLGGRLRLQRRNQEAQERWVFRDRTRELAPKPERRRCVHQERPRPDARASRRRRPLLRRGSDHHHRRRQRLDRGIRFAFRHFPLVEIHPHALAATSAAEAAALQDRFWDIHELLFHHQKALEDNDLGRYAVELGREVARFDRDRSGADVKARIRRDVESGLASGHLRGTPTLFIDGVVHVGGYDAATLMEALAG
jgi:predicted DsbA family dithiol-disulfide isomerase